MKLSLQNTAAVVAYTAFLACAGMGEAQSATVDLGLASGFALLAGSKITNTGPSIVVGNLGVSPGTAVTNFPPGIISGLMHLNDGVAIQAHADAEDAYNELAGMAVDEVLTGQDLGGMTLTPGVYFFASSAQLTGTLTLDGQGELDPLFVFLIGSTLTTASASAVLGINGADANNFFFQVGSSATLGTGTAFSGTLIAAESITMDTGSSVSFGRLVALTAAITLDNNSVSVVPEPAAAALLVPCAAALLIRRRQSRNG